MTKKHRDLVVKYYQWLASQRLHLREFKLLNGKASDDFQTCGLFFNRIFCHYPHPSLMSPYSIINTAISLAPGGNLQIQTDNIDWYQMAIEYLGNLEVNFHSNYVERFPNSIPVSLYEIITMADNRGSWFLDIQLPRFNHLIRSY
ncbi:MAG: hypothetical protein Fur009_2150 [Candidatus Microgenomates bacterium]